jgi:hypothetical protein
MFRKTGLVLSAIALVLAACGSATPAISDPKEIVTKGIAATSDAKSFHMSATVDGSVTMPQGGGPVALDGTSFEADFDIDAAKTHITFALPTSLLGLSGEVIMIGSDQYVQSSLTGPNWMHSTVPAGDITGDVTDPTAVLSAIEDFLDTEGVETTKLDDSPCGDASCYQVRITIPADQLAAAGGTTDGILPPDAFADGLALTMLFDKGDNQLAQLSTGIDAAEVGSLSVTLSFSNWDEAVSIEAPPADQVQEGGGFSF